MSSEFARLIEPTRLYRPKELGGKGKNERGLLGISYDTVIREIVGPIDLPNPGVIAKRNTRGTYRSSILIPGWVVLDWIERNLQ